MNEVRNTLASGSGSGAMLLPPKPDVCQRCAVKHPVEHPHNQQSLYWQYWFRGHTGRWPTWADAMEHCTPDMQAFWVTELAKHNITVKLPNAKLTALPDDQNKPPTT